MKARIMAAALAVLAPVIVNVAPSPADDGNYQNFIIGERAAGMGGAAVALADAVEACFYNPAGLALAPSSTISLSASLYGFHRLDVANGWFPGEGIDVDSFLSVPSTFGTIVKLTPDFALAFSALVPDKISINDLDAFPGDGHFFKLSRDDTTVWIGPSAAWRFSPRWSAGVSVFAVYRAFSLFRDWLIGDYGFSMSEDVKYNDLSLLAEAGVRFDPGNRWSFGLMVQTPSTHLSGSSEYLLKGTAGGVFGANYVRDGESANKLPAAVRAGAAWHVPRAYALGLDVTYHFPVEYDRVSGVDQFGGSWNYPLERRGVADVNAGAEYYLAGKYPVRAGFFTSFSSAPSTSVDAGYLPDHVDKYGLTLSLGREVSNTSISLGLNYVWGSGRGVGFDYEGGKFTSVLVDHEESYLLINLASSYYF